MSKRHLSTSAACVALLLAMSAMAACAQNLIVNPGFETGTLTPWSAFQTNANASVTVQSPDNGPSAAGTHNAFLDNHAEACGLTMAQTTPLGSGHAGTVYYSYDLKLGQALNGGVCFVEMFAQNAAGGVIGNAGLKGNYTPAAWTTFSGSWTAPAGTDHFTIQFETPTGAVIGTVSSMHVDNVLLTQAQPSPTTSSTWGGLKSLYR
jgi:hypothetical protein